MMMIPVAAHISEELQGMENSELNLKLGAVAALVLQFYFVFLDMEVS